MFVPSVNFCAGLARPGKRETRTRKSCFVDEEKRLAKSKGGISTMEAVCAVSARDFATTNQQELPFGKSEREHAAQPTLYILHHTRTDANQGGLMCLQ